MTFNQAITTTSTRYGTIFTVPLTATEMTVAACWTPVGTAGAADTLFVTGFQLEQGGQVSGFEARPQADELQKILTYTYAFQDGASTRRFPCFGLSSSTTVALYTCNLPVQMRAAPTVTVQTAASFAATTNAGAAANCTTMATVATSSTVNTIALSCTTGATQTQGTGVPLIGQASTGWILASADFLRRRRGPGTRRHANVNRRRTARAA